MKPPQQLLSADRGATIGPAADRGLMRSLAPLAGAAAIATVVAAPAVSRPLLILAPLSLAVDGLVLLTARRRTGPRHS